MKRSHPPAEIVLVIARQGPPAKRSNWGRGGLESGGGFETKHSRFWRILRGISKHEVEQSGPCKITPTANHSPPRGAGNCHPP